MGFYVELPDKRRTQLPDVVGPFVRLGVCTAKTWSAVVCVAARVHTQVQFSWGIDGQQAKAQAALEQIDESGGWKFLRGSIQGVQLQAAAQTISYELETSTNVIRASIPVAGAQQDWSITAYSCYDQRRAMGEALWRHMAGARCEAD